MAIKRIKTDGYGNATEQYKEPKAKVKKKPYKKPEWLQNYIIERDRLLWKLYPESRKEIEEKYI